MDLCAGRSVGVTTLMAMKPKHAAEPFDALYRQNADDLFAYVMTIVRDRASAEDVTHAAFERAYKKQDRYRPDRGSQRAWLFGIARNAALDELRRRKRTASLLVELPDTGEDDTGDDDAARRSTVRAALSSLDPHDRELVALKFFAGLSNAEIAGVLQLTESNAGTKLHRALNRLREACNA